MTNKNHSASGFFMLSSSADEAQTFASARQGSQQGS